MPEHRLQRCRDAYVTTTARLTRKYDDDFSAAASFCIGDTVRVPLLPSAAYRITQAQQAHDKDHGT